MNKPILIEDSRLTPDMERIRSGSTQLFRKRPPNNKEFTDEKNADVILIPPKKHFYADLIDGKWYWVNGCAECKGEDPTYRNTYIKCEKHDVCCVCGIPRSKLTEAPWGDQKGFKCKPCAWKEHEIEKALALGRMERKKFDEWDYRDLSEVTCPYCDYKFRDSYEFDNVENEEVECPRCDNKFIVNAEVRVSFTCKRKNSE